ncbi:AAA family ATPase [Pseudoalteromonas sp. XMcav1-K]|uniref:AAA family ATPase n=1 Tax=Pseudoalteromonas sp. XMcav1-K TaxID=3374372 RepID=UPI00375799EE
MKIKEAEYKPYKITSFQGNPLIEAIEPALSLQCFASDLTHRVISEDCAEISDFERELSVELVDLTYTVHPELYTLYKTILKNILTGYLHRNPLSVEMKAEQHKASVEKSYQISASMNLSKCISIIGVPGTGKTLAVRKCLSLLPKVLKHTQYKDQRLMLDQIVFVEFQAPVTKTRRGFVLSFFNAIDEAIGTKYYDEWKGKSIAIPVLIQEAKKIALNHSLGMVFIDEVQRCASNDCNKDDYSTLEFIDDFFNSVGVPLIVAGTPKARPLFNTTMSTTRRLSSSRKFNFDPIKDDLESLKNDEPSYWDIFLKGFYYPSLLNGEFEFDVPFMRRVYELTAGLPAMTARLMRLSYEQAIESGEEVLSIELLEEVYQDQFDLIHNALLSLATGNDLGFEDILPEGEFKCPTDKAIEDAIARDIAFHEKLARKKGADDGEVLEFEDIEQDYMPLGDMRNLKGLPKDDLIAQLGVSL